MSKKFRPQKLARFYNSATELTSAVLRGRPAWRAALSALDANPPPHDQTCWGLPFRRDGDGFLALAEGLSPVRIPLRGRATHLCFLHFCTPPSDMAQATGGGETLAEYALTLVGGETHRQPIRRRIEVQAYGVGWGSHPFAAVSSAMPRPTGPGEGEWGWRQTGVAADGSAFQTWVYALENPEPERPLAAVTLRGLSPHLVGVIALTLYSGPGHPLRHLPRKLYHLLLPAAERTTADDLSVDLDMGVVTRVLAVPGGVDEAWLQAPDRGLGARPLPDKPAREFLVEATGAPGATLTVAAPGHARHELTLGEAFAGHANSLGRARLEIVNPRTAWVHVTVTDETGQPTPSRVHFRGPRGEYLPPYGHHQAVNDKWFEDYGGDLQLQAQSFAYVPGSFQIELPVGEVGVELTKGFEYTPVRKRLQIAPGQRELRLRLPRWADLRRDRWVTADTHVHFISPQTAALEGKAEGLNLINLLASQWGRLFTNVADITGEASGCSDGETLVWVGTENRNHLLGHISMLGTRGDPVFPMCAGGPDEAYLGDPDLRALTEWARECRAKEGVVIRPHFPSPVCEEPVYFVLGELDGAELRSFADPRSGSLEQFNFREWYRYLNCGYRVAAVGGTDKMSAGMPVGGVRTYAQLGPDEEFSFATWGQAVRAGRTFTTSGPLLELTVEGQPLGSELSLPPGGGTLELSARARSAWPIHALEIVVNGEVVADSRREQGARSLSLRHQLKLSGSAWIAARCGSALQAQHCWPIHLGAHTSPVYVVCGKEELFSPSDATYMLTLLDGGMTYLDTLSVRYSDRRHAEIKALYAQARGILQQRLEGEAPA